MLEDLMVTSHQETWLWIGTIGMALGAIAILALGRGLGNHAHRAINGAGFGGRHAGGHDAGDLVAAKIVFTQRTNRHGLRCI